MFTLNWPQLALVVAVVLVVYGVGRLGDAAERGLNSAEIVEPAGGVSERPIEPAE